MFDNDHPLLSTASLTALILHSADSGAVTAQMLAERLTALFEQARKAPGLPPEERAERLRKNLSDLEIARLLERRDDSWHMTERGRQTLRMHPDGIDQTILVTFPEFAEHLRATAHHSAGMDPRVASYDEGYSARVAGEPFAANPYSENTVDHQSWENGWMQAYDKEDRG